MCRNGKYGVINSIGELLVPCSFDRIYSEVEGGKRTYYMQFENQITDLEVYLKEKGIEVNEPDDNNDDPGFIDLDATPEPNLDLKTPNVIQKNPSPSPMPMASKVPQTEEPEGFEITVPE